MAKLKFYLGYEDNGVLTPLSILDDNFQLIDTNLTDVINYTTMFNNEDDLKEAIINGPMQTKIPENAKMVYLVATNHPKYPYTKVMGLDYICYSASKSLLEPEIQVQYLQDNKYDIKFIENLYLVVLRSLLNVNQIRSFYTNEDYENESAETMIRVFNKNKSKIQNGTNYTFAFMNDIYLQCLEANRRGIENYEYDSDRLDLDYLIKRLYEGITIKRDKKGDIKYNQNNGKIERNPRIMGYLAILITKDMADKYNEYIRMLEEDEMNNEFITKEEIPSTDLYNYRSIEGHDEEFLTEEDFESLGEDPESNGYKTRGNI